MSDMFLYIYDAIPPNEVAIAINYVAVSLPTRHPRHPRRGLLPSNTDGRRWAAGG